MSNKGNDPPSISLLAGGAAGMKIQQTNILNNNEVQIGAGLAQGVTRSNPFNSEIFFLDYYFVIM
jgi:hypothetical protein